jgi:hypothetical protein
VNALDTNPTVVYLDLHGVDTKPQCSDIGMKIRRANYIKGMLLNGVYTTSIDILYSAWMERV